MNREEHLGREVDADRVTGMDLDGVRKSYARYAPFYDGTFGWMLGRKGRRLIAETANAYQGPVLEIGVGTGISLPYYRADLDVYGIDISPEMLAHAEKRVQAMQLHHVQQLKVMDAKKLDYPNDTFEVIVAAYVMSVVPEPIPVLEEIERVCRPGGRVLIVNHFAAERGLRAVFEKRLAPLSSMLGWRPDMSLDEILARTSMKLAQKRRLPPLGMFTLLELAKPKPQAAPINTSRGVHNTAF